jgi:hypothetical protein
VLLSLLVLTSYGACAPPRPGTPTWKPLNSPNSLHLNGSPETRSAGESGSNGRSKSPRNVVLFSDLSMCWYSVTYGSGGPLTRQARFWLRPESMSAAALPQRASKTHGATAVAFKVAFVACRCLGGPCVGTRTFYISLFVFVIRFGPTYFGLICAESNQFVFSRATRRPLRDITRCRPLARRRRALECKKRQSDVVE